MVLSHSSIYFLFWFLDQLQKWILLSVSVQKCPKVISRKMVKQVPLYGNSAIQEVDKSVL